MDCFPTSPSSNSHVPDIHGWSPPFTPNGAIVQSERRGLRTPASCDCGCTTCAERVRDLERRVWQLENALEAKENVIASLTVDNKQKTAEVLEVQQQKVITIPATPGASNTWCSTGLVSRGRDPSLIVTGRSGPHETMHRSKYDDIIVIMITMMSSCTLGLTISICMRVEVSARGRTNWISLYKKEPHK